MPTSLKPLINKYKLNKEPKGRRKTILKIFNNDTKASDFIINENNISFNLLSEQEIYLLIKNFYPNSSKSEVERLIYIIKSDISIYIFLNTEIFNRIMKSNILENINIEGKMKNIKIVIK